MKSSPDTLSAFRDLPDSSSLSHVSGATRRHRQTGSVESSHHNNDSVIMNGRGINRFTGIPLVPLTCPVVPSSVKPSDFEGLSRPKSRPRAATGSSQYLEGVKKSRKGAARTSTSTRTRNHTSPLQGVTPVTSRILPRDLAFQGVTQGVTDV